MHPQPLIGIAPHVVLDNFGEHGGIRHRIGVVVAGTDQGDGGIRSAGDICAMPGPR